MTGLRILNQIATQIVELSGLDPFSFFLAGSILTLIIYTLDFESGLSLDIPGKGRLGLAATVFLLSAVIMLLASEGYKFFLFEIAKTVVSLIIVTPIALSIINR